MSRLGPRGRKVVGALAFVVLGLVSFVFFLQLTFPYDRVKDKLVEALSKSYDVQVGGVERGLLPGKMILRQMTLRSKPSTAGEVPSVMFLDRLEVDVGLFALLGGVAAIDIEADVGKGTIEGTVEVERTGIRIALTGAGVQADAVPQIRDAAGLPMFGRLDLSVNLSLATDPKDGGKVDWRKTTGALQLSCARGCAIGDGKAKLKPKVAQEKNAMMVGDGIEFGTVNIDRWLARVEFAAGKAELSKWEFASADGDLQIDLALKLGKTFESSEVATGCLKFKGTEVLAKREPKTAAALTTTGGIMDTQGLFNIKLEGTFKAMKKRARLCGQGDDDGTGDKPSTAGKPGRPGLGAAAPDARRGGDEVFAKPEPPTAPPPIDAAPPATIDARPIDARPEPPAIAEPVPEPPAPPPAVEPVADPAAPEGGHDPEPVQPVIE